VIADDIINSARSQVGVKFMHQGRLAGQFLDCAGLVACVADQVGVEYNELPGYSRIPNNGILESVLDAQPCLTRVYDRQPGDILLMRFSKEPQHVAIFAGLSGGCGYETMIHTYEAVEQVCEHRLDSVWARRIVRIYRFNDIQSPIVSGVER